MDGPANEQSDSDSGESWTILEHSPSYADDAPEFPESPHRRDGESLDSTDKDDDTDGISIITDSEPESPTPPEVVTLVQDLHQESAYHPAEQNDQPNILAATNPTNISKEKTAMCDDFLKDSTGKFKTYVHRRNKRLSTVLNVILLGSVITAAGVALGHMWGAREDCSLQMAPSVNKILSNLYKLQEENAYLHSKVKELTIANNNFHREQKKSVGVKNVLYSQKCKKMFEAPLDKHNPSKITKCVEYESNDKLRENLNTNPLDGQNFVKDIKNLNNIYNQNKVWLDPEINRRLKDEEIAPKLSTGTTNHWKPAKDEANVNYDSRKNVNLINQLKTSNEEKEQVNTEKSNPPTVVLVDDKGKPSVVNKRVSYAESLKSGSIDENTDKKIIKRDLTDTDGQLANKLKRKHLNREVQEMSEDEQEITKDNRYTGNKHKEDKKKHDRQKSHKKQKRENKYEQWQMKGGYMKDYDSESLISSKEVDSVSKNYDKNHFSQDFERKNYMDQFVKVDSGDVLPKAVSDETEKIRQIRSKKVLNESRSTKNTIEKLPKEKANLREWYEQRADLRRQARKKLASQIIGESSKNSAQWYFRRMNKREQCRAQGDNTTQNKNAKRKMNFKTKR